jgi:hypothetical protein
MDDEQILGNGEMPKLVYRKQRGTGDFVTEEVFLIATGENSIIARENMRFLLDIDNMKDSRPRRQEANRNHHE